MKAADDKIRILIVCRWPLGGIRTYLRYMYSRLDRSKFDVTMLASLTAESELLREDMKQMGIQLHLSDRIRGRSILFYHVARLLMRHKFDLIHSQGFISANFVAMSNWFFRVRHVLTIHGALEERRWGKRLVQFRRWVFRQLMNNVDVIHGVGHDILEHLESEFPQLRKSDARWVVIQNGIEPAPFLQPKPDAAADLRKRYGFGMDTHVFGFFGRFMPAKGFDLVIDAVAMLVEDKSVPKRFVVLAAGGADYIREYRAEVARRNLERFIHIVPFITEIADAIKGCDAVLMPSRTEAYPLMACETLCCGVPLIATDAMGLREVTADTPALKIPREDPQALRDAMVQTMTDMGLKQAHEAYRETAAERFDVKTKAPLLSELLEQEGRRGK